MDPFTLALLASSAASQVGGLMGQRAAGQAAGAQSQAAMVSALLQSQAQQQAIQEQRAARGQAMDLFNRGVGYQEPYTQAGVGATNRLATLLGLAPGADMGSYMTQPSLEQLQMDPGYKFREQQGMRGVNASAAAGAGLQSGAALKAAQRFGQDMASQEYGNAYNRFMHNRAAAAGMLQNLAGTGAATAGNIGSQAANVGGAGLGAATNTANMLALNPIGQGLENAAQARASGYMGGATALQSALQAPAQNYMLYSMMNKFAPGGDVDGAAPAPAAGYLSGAPRIASGWGTSPFGNPML